MSQPRRTLQFRYRIEPETISLGDRSITHAKELPDEAWNGSFHPPRLAGADRSDAASPGPLEHEAADMSALEAKTRRWANKTPVPAEPWPVGSPMEIRYRACSLAVPHSGRVERSAVRALNVVVAAVGLVITAPLMLLVAVAVATTSPGPIIFDQRRVGLNRRAGLRSPPPLCRRRENHGGRIFTIYKFRTMRSDAPAKGEVWAARNDARVTRIGHFLRATRLDEVPQFFNVLKGDMNIVGPRPEQPSIFKSLATEVRDYARRQGVLPGITGLAQIELGYDTDLDSARKKVELDLEYIRRRSAARDLAIMAKTIPVMVFRKVWM